jgi:hypothetical protein
MKKEDIFWPHPLDLAPFELNIDLVADADHPCRSCLVEHQTLVRQGSIKHGWKGKSCLGESGYDTVYRPRSRELNEHQVENVSGVTSRQY